PSAASASAAALPMPDAAPRTRAILPSRRNRFRYASNRFSISAITGLTVPTLFSHLLELLHVVTARISGDPLISGTHQCAERRNVGPRHLHSSGFDLFDLIFLLVRDQLPHQVAGGSTFFP